METTDLEALLVRAAAGDAAAPDGVTLERSDLGDDLVGWRARPADAPVGAEARALVASGAHGTFARWLPRGLADLARAAGWLATPPSADVLAAAADHALMDGMLALDPDSAPSVSRDGDALVVCMTVHAFPSQALDLVEVRIPSDGPATWSRRAAPPPPEPIPIDAATGLERALAAGETLPIVYAVRALHVVGDDRARRALATAAMSPSEMVAAEALLKLASDPAARPFLREAWERVAPHRQAAARALAEALLGPGALA
ncbi:MAG: hypothetical protein IT385_10395 [Deltaproteobacteria bacterium]|nr:hypothetical protein [Deltaproteobacteria bacterium]